MARRSSVSSRRVVTVGRSHPAKLQMQTSATIPAATSPVIQYPRVIRESNESSFHEHLSASNNEVREHNQSPQAPLPFYLELQQANRQYRRAERDTFEHVSLAKPFHAGPHGTARVCEHAPATANARTNPLENKLFNARLGEILPVRDTHKVARLSSAYQPSARAGSIVDLMI